jgi:hypothetical protein
MAFALPVCLIIIKQEIEVMRTCLIIAGVLVSVFVVVVIVLVIIAAETFKPFLAMEKQSRQFVKTSITAMAEHWNPQTLVERASPKFQQQLLRHDKVARLFALYKKLGHLKRLDPPVGIVFSGMSTAYGSRTTGRYTDTAHFSNGKAHISMRIIRVGKKWQIYAFYMRSNAFLPAAPKSAAGPTTSPVATPSTSPAH